MDSLLSHRNIVGVDLQGIFLFGGIEIKQQMMYLGE